MTENTREQKDAKKPRTRRPKAAKKTAVRPKPDEVSPQAAKDSSAAGSSAAGEKETSAQAQSAPKKKAASRRNKKKTSAAGRGGSSSETAAVAAPAEPRKSGRQDDGPTEENVEITASAEDTAGGVAMEGNPQPSQPTTESRERGRSRRGRRSKKPSAASGATAERPKEEVPKHQPPPIELGESEEDTDEFGELPADEEELLDAAEARIEAREPGDHRLGEGNGRPGAAEETGERRGGRRRGRRGRGRGKSDPEERRSESADRAGRASAPEPRRNDRVSKPEATGRVMLINVSGTDECRIAVLEDGRLEELFLERASSQSHVGNIYKGRVTNVEPSIQAAFVDFGLEKNGFLHISDVQPQYFPDHRGVSEEVGRKIPRVQRPPIQKCFRRGQEVIVQVTREGVGTKGPTLTTYLSIPGRYLVMMPGMSRSGVSRKIEDEDARRRMKDVMSELSLPPGIGFILRTAGLDRNKRELQRDLNYLQRLWKTVVDRVRSQPAPAELYRESDLVTRTIRDVYTADFSRIVVDDAETAEQAAEFLQIAMPRSKISVDVHTDREPLFHRFGIEEEIERINLRHVPLPSGGSVVIDSTEAMVTIDVNSGRFRSLDDAEETAFQINMEAAEEIARQLRLRDLGGLILCDFIDMRQDRHIRAVERQLRDLLKKHKERVRVLRMSAFGIIEMTRQRQRPSMRRSLYLDCPHCRGAGVVKMPESVILEVMRKIQYACHRDDVHKITVRVSSEVAYKILNAKRSVLSQIESETGKTVIVRGEPNFTPDQIEIECEDNRSQVVVVGPVASRN